MIIGIGGVSRAGKTTLANQLSKRIKGKTIGILKQDDFVKKDHLPMIRDHIDWEHPDSIDWKSLLSAIQSYKKKYDLVIVEGLFAFYQGNINACYDRCIFVYIEKDLFWKRKNKIFDGDANPIGLCIIFGKVMLNMAPFLKIKTLSSWLMELILHQSTKSSICYSFNWQSGP